MRQTLQSVVLVAATASGLFAAATGSAHADAGATGAAAGSPGVLAGTLAQLPVHVPVNVCGNTVNVVGLLNPAAGNACANGRQGKGGHHHGRQHGGAEAHGTTGNSPGVGSGNGIQVPVDLPVNACGNTIDVVGVLNPATGNSCSDEGTPHRPPHHHKPPSEHPHQPPTHHNPSTPPDGKTPPAKPSTPPPPAPSTDERTPGETTPRTPAPAHAALAETGTDMIGLTAAGSAGALLGGVLLIRRARRPRG